MPDVLSGIEIEGVSAVDASDPNTESGFEAALARKVATPAEPVAAPVEERDAPAMPDLDSAAAIKAAALESEGGPISVREGLTTHEPGEASRRREESERVTRAREAAANDPEVAALTEADDLSKAEAEELAAYRRAEAVEEHLSTLETSDDLNERAEAWSALTADERQEAVELGYVADSDAGELTLASRLFAEALAQERATEQATRAAYEDVEARTDALDQWARERGLEGDALESRVAQIADAIRQSGQQIGHLPADEWIAYFRYADGLLTVEAEAEREARFKNDLLSESTSIGDGIEVLGPNGWIAPNAVKIAPKPNYDRVGVMPKRGETAAEILASFAEESPLEKGSQGSAAVQKRAGELFAAEAKRAEKTAL